MDSAPLDPNKTQLGGPGADPMRTQAIPTAGATSGSPTTVIRPVPTIEVRVLASREATMANGPAREQFLLELVGGAEPGLPGLGTSAARTPLNLGLVLDRSGSMEGVPLAYAKQACHHIVDLLSPDDVLSIVTFEEVVDVLMPPQRVTNKDAIKAGIERLIVGNTTNLYDGIAMGAHQVLQLDDPRRATRLVVLSDGEPTVGIKDFGTLVNQAAEIKSRGVTITFLGFGPDYNEELLAAMAKRAGGNYYYIPRPELIPEVFRAELEELLTVVARNLNVEMHLARWVTLRASTGMSAPPGERSFTIPLADLERGATIHHVFDFEFANHPVGFYRVAWGALTYDDCLSGAHCRQDLDFVIEFTPDPSRYNAPPNPTVAQALQVSMASRAVEKTIMGLKTGALNATEAISDLQRTQALLLQEGRTAEAQEVTLALRALQSGDAPSAEKTLMGAVVKLDQGKTKGP
jgi:Ca-activated chloride channel family protein